MEEVVALVDQVPTPRLQRHFLGPGHQQEQLQEPETELLHLGKPELPDPLRVRPILVRPT